MRAAAALASDEFSPGTDQEAQSRADRWSDDVSKPYDSHDARQSTAPEHREEQERYEHAADEPEKGPYNQTDEDAPRSADGGSREQSDDPSNHRFVFRPRYVRPVVPIIDWGAGRKRRVGQV